MQKEPSILSTRAQRDYRSNVAAVAPQTRACEYSGGSWIACVSHAIGVETGTREIFLPSAAAAAAVVADAWRSCGSGGTARACWSLRRLYESVYRL